ncbi:MAG: hypothetical protein U7123_24695 [Potamolinea sp.]
MSFGSVIFPVSSQELPRNNQTKISQCNQIIEITNEALSNVKSINNNDNTSQDKAMLRVANFMDKAAVELEKISVTDKTLKGSQAGFIKMYKDTSQATRNFVTAYNNRNRPESESAIQALQAATSSEKQLVADINTYCSKP